VKTDAGSIIRYAGNVYMHVSRVSGSLSVNAGDTGASGKLYYKGAFFDDFFACAE